MGNISLHADDDDEDEDEDRCERSSDLAVCRLRFPSNLRWPSNRIASQKTAHDENTSSGPEAASFSGGDDGPSLNQGGDDIFGGERQDALAGLPPQSQRGIHVLGINK